MVASKAAFFADILSSNVEIPDEVDAKSLPATLADLITQKYNLTPQFS
ncbi:MAG: hypothetical protein ACD_38C00104G0005 [uncultured bacterium]|nr:MAG: hypothetical protein ACD_38C00104G0005 [uncultured bacterium]